MFKNIPKPAYSQHDSHAANHSQHEYIHNEKASPAIMSCFRGFTALKGNKKKLHSS